MARISVRGVLAVAFLSLCVGIRADDSLAPAHVSPNPSPAAPAPPIVLPLEVLGPDGTTVTTQFNIPDGPNLNRRLKLWLEIHALRYETEASFQLNGGPWTPINSSTVTLQGSGAAFGGIGGGFSTLKMTLNLRVDQVHAGANALTFRFNGTDGRVSGFRVLAFNIVASNGARLIPEASFTQDDPSKWQPPSTSPADIQAGKLLWNAARLTAPGMGGLRAKCSSCHAQDGRDLKYFNYSNLSIRARSMFHGLSAQEGDQIASYVRSLNVPNPGRPWNPPYQPGPGLDAQPAANWSAGAGLDAVLDSDAQMQPYLMPGGSTAGWSAKSYINPREIPIAMQLPDWNSWLPVIHPMDAFGATFTNSQFNVLFSAMRSTLQPNSPAAYSATLGTFHNWIVASGNFLVPVETNAAKASWDSTLRTEIYSVSLWEMVKLWEINQEFGLEGMPQVPFGAKANVRGWYGSQAFDTSPNMMHIPFGPGLGNGSEVVHDYLSLSWYQMQLILNDGQAQQTDHNPLDYGYVYGMIKDLFANEARMPGMMLQLEWSIKSLQEFTLTGIGPQAGKGTESAGWDPLVTPMTNLVSHDWLPLWSATSPKTRTALLEAYTKAWFAQASQYTPEQYYQGGWAHATEDPATLNYEETFGGQIWFSLPRLRFFGVDPNLTTQVAAWAAKIWPQGNWGLNDSATCTSVLDCTSGY